MALSSRELKIAWLTLGVIGAVLLWIYGIGPIYDGYMQKQEELHKAEELFKNNRQLLAKQPKIEANFKKIEAMFPKDDPNKEPKMSFSEDVDAAISNILPGVNRTVEVVQSESIKDVNEYEFLVLPVRTTGELDKIAQLLKGFDQKGFLIKNIMMRHSKGPDTPDLRLEITLARIVKVQPDEGGPRRRRK